MAHLELNRFLVSCAFAATLLAAWESQSQELELPISPTPVGSGARAAGMADAFVAIADDATAASWNPAGLVQMELPELSIVGAYNRIEQSFAADDDFSGTPEQSADNIDLNYFSVVLPLPATWSGRNQTISLSYQQKYDLSREFLKREHREEEIQPNQFWITDSKQVFEQRGQLNALSLAYAIELNYTLSIGVTANFWRDSIFEDSGWEVDSSVNLDSEVFGIQERKHTTLDESYSNFRGENLTLGLLWRFKPRWSLGIRYDTELAAKADYRRKSKTVEGGVLLSREQVREQRDVNFPDTLAVGISYRANDKFTLSVDVTRTDWNDMYFESESGTKVSLVDGSDLDGKYHVKFDSTMTARLGWEYLFLPTPAQQEMPWLFTLRGGLFYDEEPASNRRGNVFTNPGNGEPDEFYGVTLGFGALAYQRVNVDLAYQFRLGNNVNSDFLRGQRGFREDVEQHRFLVSTVVYF